MKGKDTERKRQKKSDIALGKEGGKRKIRKMRGYKKMIEIISLTPTSLQSAQIGRI